MRIVRFEPRDGASYIVGFHPLTADDRKAVGGISEGGVWYTFGGAGMYDLRTHPFQSHGYLSFSYYVEKMSRLIPYASRDESQDYTHAVGHRVLCYLTGRDEGEHRPENIAQWMHNFEKWDAHWQSQLDPLLPLTDNDQYSYLPEKALDEMRFRLFGALEPCTLSLHQARTLFRAYAAKL